MQLQFFKRDASKVLFLPSREAPMIKYCRDFSKKKLVAVRGVSFEIRKFVKELSFSTYLYVFTARKIYDPKIRLHPNI